MCRGFVSNIRNLYIRGLSKFFTVMKSKMQLDKEPVRALFFKYYIPAVTSLLSVTIHQLVDGALLAEHVGKEAVAAVGMFAPIITTFIAFALMLVVGGGIRIGKSLGAGDYDKAQEIFQFTTTITLIFGALVILLAPFITSAIVTFLVGEGSAMLYNATYDYMFWGFMWIPIFLVRMILGNVISHDGAPKVARNAMVLAVILNLVLDVLLIIIFPLGVEGAAIATGLSVLFSAIYLVAYIYRGNGHFRIKGFKLTVRLKEWKELMNHGVPSFVSEISFSLGLILINRSLVEHGSMAVSVFGVINFLSFIFLRLFASAMVSALPIMSFNIGAKLPARVLATLKFSMLFTFLLGLAVVLLGLLIPDYLIIMFSGGESSEFRNMAADVLGIFFLFFLAAGPNYILGAYLQSIGKLAESIVLYLLKGLVIVGLVLLASAGLSGQKIEWIWLARSTSEIGALLLIGLYTLSRSKHYYSERAILG